MWVLMPTGGFISAVQKEPDSETGAITVRSRVRADLLELRDNYLPGLGPIQAGAGTDYPFRAVASVDDFAGAMAAMARRITYDNYKAEVGRVKGSGRARTYHLLWNILLKLQRP